MILGMKDSSASRKFADLIFGGCSKWPNWDPPVPIKVGDYGHIDKESGYFIREGSIYDLIAADSTLPAIEPPEVSEPERTMIITAKVSTANAVNINPSASISDIAEFGFDAHWKFSRVQRGAVLALAQVRHSYMKKAIDVEPLLKIDAIKGKVLVDSTVICNAYASYLSSTSGDDLRLKLTAKGTAPGIPIQGGGTFAVEWHKEIGAGLYRDAVHTEADLIPLFTVRRIERGRRAKRRESLRPEPEGLDIFPVFKPDWEPLDEDGEEDEVVL